MSAHKKVETLICEFGTSILNTGVNQKQAFLITNQVLDFTKNVFEAFSNLITDKSVISLLNNITEDCKEKILAYESSFVKAIKIKSKDFEATSVTLGQKARIVSGEKVGETKLLKETFFFQKFSMKNILKSFVTEDVLLEIIKYKQELQTKTLIENMTQTEFWRSKYEDSNDLQYLYITDYFDGFQPFNSIGKHSTPYAVDAVYFQVGPLPLFMSSKLSTIFTSQLSFSGDRKLFNNERIFRLHIEELKDLYHEGFTVALRNGQTKTIKFVPHVFRGDNKSIKEAMGFVESFNTFFPCVSCKADKNKIKSQVQIDNDLLRTRESIVEDVEINSYQQTGIKEASLWMELENFCPSINAAVDIMHDMAEGVIHYDISQVLFHFIKTKNLFTIHLLNERIQTFNFGKGAKNRPDVITIENLKANKLPTTAAETIVILDTIPYIIGDCIPKDDCHWQLILLLREVCKIILADRYAPGDEKRIETLIYQHHE